MELKVKKLRPEAILPTYATDGSACFDIYADGSGWGLTAQAYGISVSGSHTLSTGLAFEIPPGWVMKIYSRSGHGFKNDVRLANCVGVIDSDYRGELLVKLTSDGISSLKVLPGDRIAQGMLERVEKVTFVEVSELSDTARGAGGFGSTGA